MAAVDDADLERLAIEWIIKQVRGRRQMKNTLPMEGAISVPLEWAESLINYYTAPPLTADLLALVREIAASDPMQDSGDNHGTKECRYCERALVSQTFTIEEDGKTVTMDRFDFRPELRVHKPDCFWVRARALVARLEGKESV